MISSLPTIVVRGAIPIFWVLGSGWWKSQGIGDFHLGGRSKFARSDREGCEMMWELLVRLGDKFQVFRKYRKSIKS